MRTSAQTVRLGRQDFVILPKREYDRLRARAARLTEQDHGDIAEAKRRLAAPGRSIPVSEVRKRLGV